MFTACCAWSVAVPRLSFVSHWACTLCSAAVVHVCHWCGHWSTHWIQRHCRFTSGLSSAWHHSLYELMTLWQYCYQFACVSVCEHISGTAGPIFTKFFLAMARSSSGGIAIHYVLFVLWMTSHLTVVGHMAIIIIIITPLLHIIVDNPQLHNKLPCRTAQIQLNTKNQL